MSVQRTRSRSFCFRGTRSCTATSSGASGSSWRRRTAAKGAGYRRRPAVRRRGAGDPRRRIQLGQQGHLLQSPPRAYHHRNVGLPGARPILLLHVGRIRAARRARLGRSPVADRRRPLRGLLPDGKGPAHCSSAGVAHPGALRTAEWVDVPERSEGLVVANAADGPGPPSNSIWRRSADSWPAATIARSGPPDAGLPRLRGLRLPVPDVPLLRHRRRGPCVGGRPRAELGCLPVHHVHGCTPRATIHAATNRSGSGSASSTSSRSIPRNSANSCAPAAATARAIAPLDMGVLPVCNRSPPTDEREYLPARPDGSLPSAAADGRREIVPPWLPRRGAGPRLFLPRRANSAFFRSSAPANRPSTSARAPTGTILSSFASAGPAG